MSTRAERSGAFYENFTLQTLAGFVARAEKAVLKGRFLNLQDKVATQIQFLRSYHLVDDQFVLQEDSHEIGATPDRVNELMRQGRSVFYFREVCDPTIHLGGQEIVKQGNFFAICVYCPGKNGQWAEENVYLLKNYDPLLKDQLKEVLLSKNGLVEKGNVLDTKDEGDDIISFNGAVDLLDHPSHILASSFVESLGWSSIISKTRPEFLEFVRQMYALDVSRQKTHDINSKYFVLDQKYMNGSFYVFDTVLQSYVPVPSSARTEKLLSQLSEKDLTIQQMLYRRQTGAVVSGIGLSARTSEHHLDPHQTLEITEINVDGSVRQITLIIPATSEAAAFLGANMVISLTDARALVEKYAPDVVGQLYPADATPQVSTRNDANVVPYFNTPMPLSFGGGNVGLSQSSSFSSEAVTQATSITRSSINEVEVTGVLVASAPILAAVVASQVVMSQVPAFVDVSGFVMPVAGVSMLEVPQSGVDVVPDAFYAIDIPELDPDFPKGDFPPDSDPILPDSPGGLSREAVVDNQQFARFRETQNIASHFSIDSARPLAVESNFWSQNDAIIPSNLTIEESQEFVVFASDQPTENYEVQNVANGEKSSQINTIQNEEMKLLEPAEDKALEVSALNLDNSNIEVFDEEVTVFASSITTDIKFSEHDIVRDDSSRQCVNRKSAQENVASETCPDRIYQKPILSGVNIDNLILPKDLQEAFMRRISSDDPILPNPENSLSSINHQSAQAIVNSPFQKIQQQIMMQNLGLKSKLATNTSFLYLMILLKVKMLTLKIATSSLVPGISRIDNIINFLLMPQKYAIAEGVGMLN